MGDNASKSWEWHNNEIGIGYKAKHVVRQPGLNPIPLSTKIIDMTGSKRSTCSTSKDGDACNDITFSSAADTKLDTKRRKDDNQGDRDEDDSERGSRKKGHKKHTKKNKKDRKGGDGSKKDKRTSKRSREDVVVDESVSDTDTGSNEACGQFNPILQYFATRISNKTMSFSANH